MKLDWDLMRTILAHVETETIREFVDDAESMAKWKEGQLLSERQSKHVDPAVRVVFKHIELLQKGGFLEGVHVDESLDGFFQIEFSANPSLTLSGYSLLESLRSDGFLDKLKAFAKEKSIPLTVETVRIVGAALLQRILT